MPDSVTPGDELTDALALFNVALPVTREQVETRYHELRVTWHPHRYASLSNNPRKYMTLVRQGEAMTKRITNAYRVLRGWVDAHERPLPRSTRDGGESTQSF